MSAGLFFSLNIGVNALDAMQQSESVVSNNISNAATPGYTLENANMTEAPSFPPFPFANGPVLAGQLGQGSQVGSVTRAVDPFLNNLVRDNQSQNSGYAALQTKLDQLQGIFGDPTDTGLQSAMSSFFGAWQTVSTNPGNMAARQTVLQQADNLTKTFGQIQSQIESWKQDTMNVLGTGTGAAGSSQVDEVNTYATQLNALNQQIVQIQARGQNPNQLLDQRDSLLLKLSQLGDVSTSQNSNGSIDVTFGNVQVVGYSATAGYTTQSFTAADVPGVTSGQMWANQQALNTANSMLTQLGNLQTAIANGVNSQQAAGYTYNSSTAGPAMFSLSTTTQADGQVVTDLSLAQVPASGTSPARALQPTDIAAASAANAPGDGNNAAVISQMAAATNLPLSATATLGSTPNDYYASMIANLGGQAAEASNQEQMTSAMLTQAQNEQQSVSGVNTNEEASKMIQYQNIFNAAAKFVSVVNDMLQTLVQEV